MKTVQHTTEIIILSTFIYSAVFIIIIPAITTDAICSSEDLLPCNRRAVHSRATGTPVSSAPFPHPKATSSLPPLPAVHPCRLLNSASLTKEQTNKTPWGNEATSGNRHSERGLVHWCGIDHYWRKGKEKEGKMEIWREELWSDGVDWAVCCCWGEKRWQDKTLISDSGNETTTFWVIVLRVVVWI